MKVPDEDGLTGSVVVPGLVDSHIHPFHGPVGPLGPLPELPPRCANATPATSVATRAMPASTSLGNGDAIGLP